MIFCPLIDSTLKGPALVLVFCLGPVLLQAQGEGQTDLSRLELAYRFLASGDLNLARIELESLTGGPFADLALLELVRIGPALKKKPEESRKELQEIGNQELRYRAGLALIRSLRDWDHEADALALALEEAERAGLPGLEARFLAAQILIWQRHYPSAERQLLRVLQSQTGPWRGRALLQLAQLYLQPSPLYNLHLAERILERLKGEKDLESEVREEAVRLAMQLCLPLAGP